MIPIQKTIANYMRRKTRPTPNDLRTFVEMVERQAATVDDFRAVGGRELVNAVMQAYIVSIQKPELFK